MQRIIIHKEMEQVSQVLSRELITMPTVIYHGAIQTQSMMIVTLVHMLVTKEAG